MTIRYRWSSVGISILLLTTSSVMLWAFLDLAEVTRIIGITGIAFAIISLMSLGASLMMPDEVTCPTCGKRSRLHVRMSGAPELKADDANH